MLDSNKLFSRLFPGFPGFPGAGFIFQDFSRLSRLSRTGRNPVIYLQISLIMTEQEKFIYQKKRRNFSIRKLEKIQETRFS